MSKSWAEGPTQASNRRGQADGDSESSAMPRELAKSKKVSRGGLKPESRGIVELERIAAASHGFVRRPINPDC